MSAAKPMALTAASLAPPRLDLPRTSAWRTVVCLLSSDFLVLVSVFAVAVVGRHLLTSTYHLAAYVEVLPLLSLALIAFGFQGLYPGVLMHPAEEIRRILVSVTTVFLVMACSAFLWRNVDIYSRSVFLITWAVVTPAIFLARVSVRHLFKSQPWWGIPTVLLGSGKAAQRVARSLQNKRWGISICGVLTDTENDWPADLPPLLGPLELAQRLVASRFSEYAIVAMPNESSKHFRRISHHYCCGFRKVIFVPDFDGMLSLGIVARQLGSEMGFEVPQCLFQVWPAFSKRLLDIALSSLGILALLPVFVVLALCVRFSSPGTIFYGQERYGRNGSIFKALKFRTMVPNADRVLARYLETHPELLFEWQRDHKLRRDPRITTAGRWLRRLSLDELPQLFNVLLGQMSLVGPRPIVEAEIAKYGECYSLYTRVRPGITGLWQVSGRNNTTYDERVSFDEFYVNNWSIWLDAYILFRTFRTLATAEGAY